MTAKKTASRIALFITGLLLLDQVVKIAVKTSMYLNEHIPVFGKWFYIRFIENSGAAFGAELGGDYGKLMLSLFRIVAVAVIIWYLSRLVRKKAPTGVLVGFSLILAGALGNIIDSAFYGMVFSESGYTPDAVASLFPAGGGYASFLHGKVVDMLYFPLFSGTYPSWFPWVGGEGFTFFSPVFNVADSYITVGVIYLLLFQYKFFK